MPAGSDAAPKLASGGSGKPDGRGLAGALGIKTKEDYNPDLWATLAQGLAVRPRDFR